MEAKARVGPSTVALSASILPYGLVILDMKTGRQTHKIDKKE